MTGNSLEYLTAFLNSKLFKFTFKDYFPELLGETREMRKIFFETISVKPAMYEDWFKQINDVIIRNKENKLSTKELEKEIDNKIFDLYELTDAERSIILSSLDPESFSEDSINNMSVAESR
ncbi:MAG: class SAM-dependent methyltransferase [Chitinophagaceae bacterium]|nr:class SAM-dependent methyltransferase [Chitinophagaceae bacterium]